MQRHIPYLLSFGLMVSAPVFAADRQWDTIVTSDEATLFYGVPESEDVTLSIVCKPTARQISLVSLVLPPRPKQRAALETKLHNGAATRSYKGTIGRDPGQGPYYVEAPVAFDPTLFEFLKTGSSLTIEVPGKREVVPLRGISRPLATVQQDCLGRR